jgi:predicted nucleic acid-binding protein
MIVIADTSPVNYLALIGLIDILPQLLGSVLIPEAVHNELQREKTPQAEKDWLGSYPAWLEIKRVDAPSDEALLRLDPGEHEAISLSEALCADLLLDSVGEFGLVRP